MWHRKFDKEGNQIDGCGGRIFIDRAFSNEQFVELSCIECGIRHILDVDKSLLAKQLVRIERRFLNASNS